MAADKEFQHLIQDEWDTYRDLEKVYESHFCRKGKYGPANTLVLDSDARKVQRCLGNAIVGEAYCLEDVDGKPRLYRGKSVKLDDFWQEQYLQDLGDFIVTLLDEAESVPDYLRDHPSEYTAPDLLTQVETKAA